MATKVLVIITDNKIYSTYVETICFTQEYSNEQEKEDAYLKATSTAFGYACNFGSVCVDRITLSGILTDQDIFNYLANHKI